MEELENRGLESPGSSVDNAEDPAAIDGWMPRPGAIPHHLALARLDRRGRCARRDVFPPDVAVDYLCEAAGRSQPQDREEAAALAKSLAICSRAQPCGGLLRSRDTDFKDYLEKLAERVKEKPDRRSRAGKALVERL